MALQIVIKNPNGDGMIHPIGFPTGLQVPNIYTLFHSLGDILSTLSKKDERNLENCFYTLGHHASLGQHLPTRKIATFDYQNVIAWDIDYPDPSHAYDYLAIVASILCVAPSDLTLINSGNGLHVIANLKEPIKSSKEFSDTKAAYNEVCFKIKSDLEWKKLPGKVDPVVYEPTRIMRLPGTINQKNGELKECQLMELSDSQLEIDLMRISGLDQIARENIAPENVRRNFPRPDFPEIVKECDFIQRCISKPEEVHEPNFFDLVSLLAVQDPAAKVHFRDKDYTSIELAEFVFNSAVSSKSLAAIDFQPKWESSSRYGARKCSTIATNWIGVCQGCKHRDKIPTPLAIKSKEHVGSEDTGFWLMSAKGKIIRPHYGDLAKVYSKESSYVATQEARILTHEDTHYVETSENWVRAWVEKRVNPTDELLHSHCNEFVRKVQRTGAVHPKQEDELFNKSVLGKLNCKNGVLDIRTGELSPHSPRYGFMYTLPYEYTPNEQSEEFLTWLQIITKGRQELVDSILDMMAYIFWPNYDDHIFLYLVGEGKNGKSTILSVIAELVGKENFSAVSIQQLGSNRFAPAELEGKLVNICEESSGYEMSLEEMNVIKNLSAGGEMMVERKNQQAFTFKNKAKLIFSANKPPRFKEAGVAITRRMVVIPFDYEIERVDPNIGKLLLSECPKILSMLISRIQDNVKSNGGYFMVSRGGVAATDARNKVLMSGNNAVEWGKECVESKPEFSDDQYVLISDAYYKYTQWCQKNGYSPQNRNNFSNAVSSFILHIDPLKDNRIYSEGKRYRVFKKCRLKDETL